MSAQENETMRSERVKYGFDAKGTCEMDAPDQIRQADTICLLVVVSAL